jgi:hypothetical protein
MFSLWRPVLAAPRWGVNEYVQKIEQSILTYVLTYLPTYLITYLFTSSSRVLEKLTGSQLVKFPAFCGTQGFLITYTIAHHLSLSWARSVQSMLPNCTSWRSILILSSTYARVIQVFSFTQVSTPKPWLHLSSSLYMLRAPPISSPIWSPNIWWLVQIIKLLSM